MKNIFRNSWNGEGSPLQWEDGGASTASPGAHAPPSPNQGAAHAPPVGRVAPLGVKEKDAINEYLRSD